MGSVRLDRFDPQAIEAMAVTAEQREDETLARLVASEQLAQALRGLERAAGLRERLPHHDLRVVADPLLHVGVPFHGPSQLVQGEGLLGLTVPQGSPDHLGGHRIEQRNKSVGEVGDESVADVVEGLRLHPVAGLGVLEESVEVRAEQVGLGLDPEFAESGLDQLPVTPLPTRDGLLLRLGPAVGSETDALLGTLRPPSLAVGEGCKYLGHDTGVEPPPLPNFGHRLQPPPLRADSRGSERRIVAGQAVSEAGATLLTMSAIVDLAAWKRRRARAPDGALPGNRIDNDPAVDRLDRAVERLHGLVAGELDGGSRVDASVETELLAIMGELAVGLIPDAADRAERLADQLAR